MRQKFCIRIPASTKAAIANTASNSGLSSSQVVEAALTLWIKTEQTAAEPNLPTSCSVEEEVIRQATEKAKTLGLTLDSAVRVALLNYCNLQ